MVVDMALEQLREIILPGKFVEWIKASEWYTFESSIRQEIDRARVRKMGFGEQYLISIEDSTARDVISVLRHLAFQVCDDPKASKGEIAAAIRFAEQHEEE